MVSHFTGHGVDAQVDAESAKMSLLRGDIVTSWRHRRKSLTRLRFQRDAVLTRFDIDTMNRSRRIPRAGGAASLVSVAANVSIGRHGRMLTSYHDFHTKICH